MIKYSSIAIVIPTLDRHDFLLRTIKYYLDFDIALNLFVGDSTTNKLCLPEFLSTQLSGSNLNFQYFHLPGLDDRQAISLLAHKVSLCDIEFICFHGDDDYFVPESLLDCAIFLDRNPDYSSAQGRACTISLEKSGPFGVLKAISSYWQSPSLSSQSCLKRLNEFVDSYFVLQFSVHRTSEFVDSCISYQHVPDRNWGELYQCFYFALQGKSYFLDKLYLVRHVHPAINHERFANWMTSFSFSRGFIFAVENLSSSFCDSINDTEFLVSTIERYLYSKLARKLARSPSVPIPRFKLSRVSALWLRFLFLVDQRLFPLPSSRDSFFYSFRRIMHSFSVVP